MKYKNIFRDVVFVSQLTGVDKKKIRILLSVILANLTVFFDILVILVFANLIDKSNINEKVDFANNVIIDEKRVVVG